MFRGIALLLALGIAPVSAMAETVHQLRFAQPATVLVWQADDLIGQGAQVSVSPQGQTTAPGLIGSGKLLPVAETAISRDQSVQLSIASNSGFAIKLSHLDAPEPPRVRVLNVGTNAVEQVAPQMGVGEMIFVQASKTARRPGPAKSQALDLEIFWTSATQPNFEIIAVTP